MKYRLKDEDLQRKLDALTDNKFSKSFEKSSEHVDVCKDYCEDFVICGVGVIRVRLYENSFEKVPEYDPNHWNEWPDVEPPEGVLMRVEVKYRDRDLDTPEPTFGKIRERTCARFTGEYWIRSDGSSILFQMDEIVRFRPWEE